MKSIKLKISTILLLVFFKISAFAQSNGNPQFFEATEFSGGVCVDTAPLGDGWGWNGDCGCRLNDETAQAIPRLGFTYDIDENIAAIQLSGIRFTCARSNGLGIFEQTSDGWENTANLITSARQTGDFFPVYVAVSGDVVVASSVPGAMYLLTVFRKDGEGQWHEEQVIDTGTGRGENAGHMFDIDGDHIVIPTNTFAASTAHVYTNDGTGNWVEQVITLNGIARRAEVLGDTLVVSNTRGEFYVYRYIDEQWQQEALLTAAHIPPQFGLLSFNGPQFSLTKDIIFTRHSTFIRTTSNEWIEYPEANVHTTPFFSSVFTDDELFPMSKTAPLTVERDGDQLKTFMLRDNVWQNIDSIEFDSRLDLKFDGKTVLAVDDLMPVSLAVNSDGYFVGATADSIDLQDNIPDSESTTESNPSIVGTDSPITGECDYTDAASFDGWGWNSITMTSCPPLVTSDNNGTPNNIPPASVIAPASNCDYSNADQFGGWGWDPVAQTSCAPNESTAALVPANNNEAEQCDYSNAHLYGGWGWNSTLGESCAPQATQELTTPSNNCVDDDNDGWGWNGTASCRVTAAQCIDPDGDGWGWDGTSSCRV